MGAEYSQHDYDRYSLVLYKGALEQPCLLPDVGIDESLLKYSGLDSNAVLQSYSNELVSSLPGYVSRLGTTLGRLNSVPNAVGLGALVISMIMELCIKSTTQTNDNSYSMFQRVFGVEKASGVRDTMSEYLRRHRIFLNNNQRLQRELRRLEEQLSNHLTILRNSLLHDGQMSTRGFKIWVNGASFHLQMLIHEARLNILTGTNASDYENTTSDHVSAIEAAIGVYLQELDDLLEKYKTHKTSTTAIRYFSRECVPAGCTTPARCFIENDETGCSKSFYQSGQKEPCAQPELIQAYMDHVFSKYEPISGLKSHFSNIKINLNSLITQHISFTVPSAG